MPHYTAENQNIFVERITADFIGQIARRLEISDMSQSQFALRLGVSESEVSQVLNLNRTNLTLKKIARFAHGLGMKVAVVAYDDNDPANERGPVGSEIFSQAWEKNGRPRTVLALRNTQSMISINSTFPINQFLSPSPFRIYGFNTTFADSWATISQLPQIPLHLLSQKKANTAHAGI